MGKNPIDSLGDPVLAFVVVPNRFLDGVRDEVVPGEDLRIIAVRTSAIQLIRNLWVCTDGRQHLACELALAAFSFRVHRNNRDSKALRKPVNVDLVFALLEYVNHRKGDDDRYTEFKKLCR